MIDQRNTSWRKDPTARALAQSLHDRYGSEDGTMWPPPPPLVEEDAEVEVLSKLECIAEAVEDGYLAIIDPTYNPKFVYSDGELRIVPHEADITSSTVTRIMDV